MKNYKNKLHKVKESIINIFRVFFNFNKIKKIRIHKINESIVNIFNKFHNLDKLIISKFKKNKFSQISNFNKVLIFLIFTLFLYLFYLSIPSLYNKGRLQKVLTEKLASEFKINLSISSEISYSILPAPHFLIKNTKIFNDDLDSPKELSQIKKLKIFISQKYLYDEKKINIKSLSIKEANIYFQAEDLEYLSKIKKNKFSSKKISLEKSQVFYKDKNDELVTIFSIIDLDLFHIEEKQLNQVMAKGEIFNIPYKFKWLKNFETQPISTTLLKLNDLKIDMKNLFLIQEKKSINEITIDNSNLNTNYEMNKDLFKFSSFNSKINNSKIDYNGKIDLEPFNLKLNIDLSNYNIAKVLKSKSIIKELLNSELLFNENLSGNIVFNTSDNSNNRLFNSSKILFNFKNGQIDLDNSLLVSNKIGNLSFNNSKLFLNKGDLIFNSNFIMDIDSQKEFYKVFQVPKNNRIDLKRLLFSFEINIFEKRITFNNFNFNDLSQDLEENIQIVLNNYNNIKDNYFENWIDIKFFVNSLFDNYEG